MFDKGFYYKATLLKVKKIKVKTIIYFAFKIKDLYPLR